MKSKPTIFIINGSASQQSANEKLINKIINLTKEAFDFIESDSLKLLPHFDPDLSTHQPPGSVINFRNSIQQADGLLICTPEYIFSIPSGLKNAIEWCVATTVFSDKPTGLITASASGQKGNEELQLIMKTVMAKFTADTTLLIRGIKGKINDDGEITDSKTVDDLTHFLNAYKTLVEDSLQ